MRGVLVAVLAVAALAGLALADKPSVVRSTYEVRTVSLGAPVNGSLQRDRFTVAVLRAQFDQQLYVNGTLMKDLLYSKQHQSQEDRRNRHHRGLTRLVCPGGRTFESHPPLKGIDFSAEGNTHLPVVPTNLMPLVDVPPQLHDLVSLFDLEVDFPDSDQYVAVLVLSHDAGVSRSGFMDHNDTVNLAPSQLPQCQLNFLAEDNQTWLGTGLLSNFDYEQVDGQLSLEARAAHRCSPHHSLVDAVKHFVFRAVDYAAHMKEAERDVRLASSAPSRFGHPESPSHMSALVHETPFLHVPDPVTPNPNQFECDAEHPHCRDAPSSLYFLLHPFSKQALVMPSAPAPARPVPSRPSDLRPNATEAADGEGVVEGATAFFEFDIAERAHAREHLQVMQCLALDQQQRLAEDIAMEMKTKFIGGLIQIMTLPIVSIVIPILAILMLLIMMIPIIILLIIVLIPYIEPFFEKLQKGSKSPYMQMMMEISPLYYGLWSYKKNRMTELSGMIGTGILTPFMRNGLDGGGGWGPLIMLVFGAVMNNIAVMYEMIDVKASDMIPRVVVKLVSLLVPPAIGNYMCGPLAAKVVKAAVSKVTHDVVHNSNYALTHSLTQSVTQAVTEAMRRKERHYYYCLFCYYQGKYCEYCSVYNQYAHAGKNLNNLTEYPGDMANLGPTPQFTR